MRWDPYLLASGDKVPRVWQGIRGGGSGKCLFIGGKGFDPRTTLGVRTLFNQGMRAGDEITLLDMKSDRESSATENLKLAEQNLEQIRKLAGANAKVQVESVQLWEADAGGWRRTGPELSRSFARSIDLNGFTDIVVDVSALPRGVFFPLIATLIKRLDEQSGKTNLHIFAAESASLDTRIVEEAVEEMAYFVPSFNAAMQVESEKPIIWFPLLAEKRLEHVERVQMTIEQVSEISEVCPVLPMPASNPRQPDKLIMEYHDFLLNRWKYDPRTLLYVAEQNPFQTYRLLVQSVRHYNKALAPLGGCRAVLSAHSSKLMSIGVLLAAYELKDELDLGLANVDAGSHRIDPPLADGEDIIGVPVLMGPCGEAYLG